MTPDPDLIPVASVILISNSGSQQIITDTLVVPSVSFTRSASDLITTCSFEVAGAYDIPLSPPQTIAVEYEGAVKFIGVVTDCDISYQAGVATTNIQASDMAYLLSHQGVPYIDAEWRAVTGMTGPGNFGDMSVVSVFVYFLERAGIADGYGIYVSDKFVPGRVDPYPPGTTALDVIIEMANAYSRLFFIYYKKINGVYVSNAFFAPVSHVSYLV